MSRRQKLEEKKVGVDRIVIKDGTVRKNNWQSNESIESKGIKDFDYLSAEFLLKLPNEPDMNFAETLPQSVGDMDNHSLAVARNINLAVENRKQ